MIWLSTMNQSHLKSMVPCLRLTAPLTPRRIIDLLEIFIEAAVNTRTKPDDHTDNFFNSFLKKLENYPVFTQRCLARVFIVKCGTGSNKIWAE